MTPFRSFLCPVLVGALSALPAFAADGDLAYRVQQGDTLLTLSRELLTPPHNWRDLKARNRVADVQRIPAGTLLQVPASWTRAERLSARVERIHGKVTANGSPLSVGNVVSAGAVLRSGEDSFATLALPDGSKLTLQPDSEATMERLQHYRGFDGFDTSLAVTRGRIDTQAAKQRGPAARYRITTPSAVIGVRGTEFRVAAEGESLARAEVTEGEVAVSPAEGGSRAARALPAGFGIVARAGQPIPVPRALLPAPLLAGLPALQERLALRFPFAAVAGAHAYRVQLAADAGFRDLLAEGVFATPLARFGELPDGSYWLRARAIDDDGLEGLDAVRQFVVHARPLPPMATGPANGAKLRTEEVSFGWLPSGEAARYRLQVARDAAFSELVGSESETEASAVRMHLPVGDYQCSQVGAFLDEGEYVAQRGPIRERLLSIRRTQGIPVEG
ncbi:MAG: hypothetical protein HGA47_14685, partial [Zoogloea sp.]|nr:hypothetical protein [Zoogloea sp.]